MNYNVKLDVNTSKIVFSVIYGLIYGHFRKSLTIGVNKYIIAEYFQAIENRDTAIMMRDEKIKEQDTKIAEQGTMIAEQGTKIAEQRKFIMLSAKALKDSGMSEEQISSMTGLPAEDIEKL